MKQIGGADLKIRTVKELERKCRRAIYRQLAPRWEGTRETLRRAIRGAIRGIAKPLRANVAWMLRVVREARFAALVAGAVGASMIAGLAGSAQAAIELSDVTAGTGGFAMSGEAAFDYSGGTVSAAGDVNGDGFADVIVGAGANDSNGTSSGRSYVVFGKVGGTLVQLSDLAAGAGGFAIDGKAYDAAGVSVSEAGDVNGDGIADLIVGASGVDSNGVNSGSSYVVFGKATGTLVQITDVTAGTGGFAIDGEAANDDSGYSVSAAGDVNGDGLADLIVGALGADPNGSSSGRSYVVFGKATGTLIQLSDVTAGTGGFTISGEAAGDVAGLSVSTAGDVNGDGLADVIVGARYADPNGAQSGRSYVVFGKANGANVQLSDVALFGTGGFAINGEVAGDEAGFSVSGAGDVNGDGLADLIVGARGADPNGNGSGRSYVVFGKSTGALVQLSDVTAGAGGFAMNGENVLDRSGRSVSAAGDVNGDGFADVIVGAYLADPNLPYGSAGGRSYVVFGKTGGTLVQLSAVTAGAGGFAIDGEGFEDYSGNRVSSAGDVNGDGLTDLIVGAFRADPNGDRSGRSYVVFSPEAAAASGTYIMKTLPGDGAGGFVAPITDFGDVARCKIDFSDADSADNGAGGASTETLVLTRSKSGITNLTPASDVANVVWEITTDRIGFTDANVTLKYLDSEITGISGTESGLSIFTAPAASGPWTELASTVDTARNEISATVTGFSFFAIAKAGTVPVELSGFEID